MISYIKGDNKEKLCVYLLLSSLKKKIDNYKNISPKNINSGYTDIINRYIFIWREEEFEKVLFHELIHFFNHDHSNEIYTHHKKFDSLFEAITDFKAIIYNLIYLSLLKNKKLSKLINYEFSFINNQGIMINNLINSDIVLESPAFSYYVLKLMLLKYIVSDDFTESDYNNLFIQNKHFNKIILKLKSLTDTKYIDFKSSRMSYFELE
jgi:hypothetical protein